MAKKIKHTKSWGFSSSEQSFDRYLKQFLTYIKKDELSNAEAILEKMERNFPSRKEVLMCGLKLANELEDLTGYYEKAEEFIAKYPDDPEGYMALIDMYHEEEYNLLYCDMLEKFCDHFADDLSVSEMRESLSDIKLLFSELLEKMELEGNNSMNIAMLMEKSQFMLDIGKVQESCEILENLIIEEPNFLPAFNQLSTTFFAIYNVKKAIEVAEKVLEKDANNYTALGKLVHYSMVLGETKLAEKYLVQLKKLDNDHFNIYLEKAEAMAWCEDNEGLVELGKEAQLLETSEDLTPELSEIPEDLTAEFWHYIAVGYSNLGDEKKARQLWKKSLKIDPDFECAENNLTNLTLPPGEKIKSWAFELTDWIPFDIIEQVSQTLENRTKEKQIVCQALEDYPHLISLIPILLKRGDSDGREFVIYLYVSSEKPELMLTLKEFAFSQDSTDEERMNVMQHLVSKKLVPSGKVTMWIKGKQKELLFMGVELHNNPSVKHSPKIAKMLEKALDLIRDYNGKEAELILLKALKLEPSAVDLQFNLANAYIVQDRKKESIEMITKIHQEYPDYSYARLSLAQFHIEDNEFQEAEELLKPLLEKKEFQYKEFSSFCEVQINLAMKKKDFKEANSWLQMWGRMGYEDSSDFEYWQDELNNVKIKM